MVHEVEFPKIPQSICLQGTKLETNMKRFYQLLQTLIDSKAKPNSIIGFCKDLYDYKHAQHNYENAPTRAIQRARYDVLARYHFYVNDWLRTFKLEDKYKPEDFLED